MNKESVSSKNPDTRVARTLRSDLGDVMERFREDPSKLIVSLGAAAAVAVGIAITPKILEATDTQNRDPEFYSEYYDSGTTQLTLMDGANIRKDPRVDTDELHNLIGSLVLDDDSTLVVNSPEGIYVHDDTNNGTWYGVPASDLSNIDGVSNDKDGIVWINEERAYSVDSSSKN